MDDFLELEADLKRLRPAPVSAVLMLQVENALLQKPGPIIATAGILAPRQSAPASWLPFGLGLAAAIALFAIALSLSHRAPNSKTVASSPSSAAISAAEFQPSSVTRVVYDTRDEGLLFPNSSPQPLRRTHYQTRETMQWRNPGTGASLRVSYPAEEVVLTPVSFQ
jgi:hypothetical protein